MKKLQQFCATAVLIVALALSVFAGEIGAPGAKNPEPHSSSTAGEIGAPGDTGDTLPDPGAALDPVTEAALNMLQSLLSLF